MSVKRPTEVLQHGLSGKLHLNVKLMWQQMMHMLLWSAIPES